MSTRDDVSLSARERQVLAHLEARVRTEDPALAARLRGRRWRAIVDRTSDWHLPEHTPGVGPLVFMFGLVITVFAITNGIWLSVLGIAITVVGGCAMGKTLRERLGADQDPGD
ncbi:MAG TPA: DUF3040 domain-containing protein [Acidimicrobiales bacterium]|jgi:hypothetical protein|nr:DUF3040 domain-containing protein [Acidimicrobiales bacterium]